MNTRRCTVLKITPFLVFTLLHFGYKGWFMDMKPHHYLFPGDENYTCQVWLKSVRKSIILHQLHLPFPPILAHDVGFSKWNHTSICFQGMKNTCAKFGPDPSKHGGAYKEYIFITKKVILAHILRKHKFWFNSFSLIDNSWNRNYKKIVTTGTKKKCMKKN